MRKLLFAIFALLVGFTEGTAQQFPITVIPQITQPAPVNLSNYADASTLNSPIQLRLLLNDITASNEQIRLKTYFEGNGISFESKDLVIGAEPLFIDGGTPLLLNNQILAPYFEFQNIRGINPNTYGTTIPEGNYRFCFEVFDAVTGNRLASKTCTTTYIFRNEPPLLNLPLNKINIEPSDVENIVFQWTPRHINVSNVEYELSIVEIWDDTVDPQTAFLSSVPVFETTTRSTSFIYGPSQPLLLSGKRYAWRIRAKALQGAEEIGLFKNEGKSEIYWFSRTAPCAAPLNVYAEGKGVSKINIFWEENPSLYREYTIAYREANKPDAEWFMMRTNSGWATIWHLKPGTTYEYKVRGKCKFQDSEFSEIQEVTTATEDDDNADYNCGIVPDEIAISNRSPHPGLSIGDRITAGDFVITLTEISSQSNGIISGKGFVSVPYLKYARLAVNYQGILVNTDNQLAQGEVVTAYDENFGDGAEITVDVEINPIEIFTGDQGEISTATVDYDIATIERNDQGGWTITGTNGEQGTLPGGEDIVITDEDGDTYSVSEDGTITQGEMAPGGPVTADTTNGVDADGVNEIQDVGVRVTFINSGTYAFDQKPALESTSLALEYPKVTKDGKEEAIPFKAVSKLNGNDIIKATVTFDDDSYTKEDIIFKTKEGVLIPASWNEEGDEATLTLVQTFDYAVEDIVATVPAKDDNDKHHVIGTFKLVHLGADRTNIDLVIVPVNNARIENGLERKINDIYNKAGVNFNTRIAAALEISSSIWDQNSNGVLDVGDSSLLSYYTDEENAIAEYFKTQPGFEENKYYIFITDEPVSDGNTDGFMPLKGQFGFVFSNSNQGRIAAHELGHGVFGLEHPFKEYGTPEGATDFLMDYAVGIQLSHMDWKKMHAPGLQLYWFQGDDDGASVNLSNEQKKSKIEKIIAHIKNRNLGIDEALQWASMMQSRNGRNGLVTVSLKGTQEFLLGLKKSKFSLEKYPSGSNKSIKVGVGKETLAIKEEKFFKKFGQVVNILYELTIPSGQGDFVFQFDHHDEIEAFCNALKIGRDQSYTKSNQSDFSKEIIRYLENNHFTEGIITENTNCNTIDLFFTEIPSDYLGSMNEFKLWGALKSLLKCSVNDWGVSEEEAVINIITGLAKHGEDKLLDGLLQQRMNHSNDLLFKTLYSKLDNWGGQDNFTKFINTLYTIWANSSKNTMDTVDDVPYQSKKNWGFYSSKFDVSLNREYTKVTLKTTKGIRHKIQHFTYGPYSIFDPIALTDYESIKEVAGNIEVGSVKVPVFIIAAIAQNHSTSNTSRTANFAFDAALTFSGVGNISKLRYLRQLGKLKPTEAVALAEGITTSLGVVNFMLEYSDQCTSQTAYCAKLKQYLSLVESSLSLGTGYAFLLKRKAGEVLEEMEKGADNISDTQKRKQIIEELRKVAGQTSESVFKDLWVLDKAGKLSSVKLNIKDVSLTLSTISYLLKNGICKTNTSSAPQPSVDEDSDLCKEVEMYLGYVQKAIAAKGVADQAMRAVADRLQKKIQENEDTFGDAEARRKVSKELDDIIVRYQGLLDYPNIRKSLSEVQSVLKSKGIDQYLFEDVLKQSKNLAYLEENASLLPNIAKIIDNKKTKNDLLQIFSKAVNEDFVQKVLPLRFVSTLKDFGKTEKEIFEYFKNYHNVHTNGDFFNKIEDVLIKNSSSTMNKEEAFALWGYTTNFFYRDLNAWLRNNTNFVKTDRLGKLLKDAIRKVPNYKGTAFRALQLDQDALKTFLETHKTGSKVTYKDFISAGSTKEAAFFDKPEKNVKLIMDVHRAPDISEFADGIKFRGYKPKEILLRRGSQFEILDVVHKGDNNYEIYMKQIN